ncbi:hypothetical protein H701_01962 [Staphylococcus epidermidis 528m]|nr:hypothetical protein H701_01962 [Staphylococcus epidermidis 528m]
MGSIISALISMLGVLIVFYKTREYQSNIHKEKLEEDAKNKSNQSSYSILLKYITNLKVIKRNILIRTGYILIQIYIMTI